MRTMFSLVVILGLAQSLAWAEETDAPDSSRADGVLPRASDGRPLNLDFERGTLEDWIAEGEALRGQPIKGDTVHARRADMHSEHEGDYWLGTFEVGGDKPQGTLTSVPFEVTHPYASFLVGGGRRPTSRVELIDAETEKAFFRVSGDDVERMNVAVVDLQEFRGQRIAIKIIDQWSGGWGHINFDDFRFHESKPTFDRPAVPHLDVHAHAGLSPDEAAAVMSVPEGFEVRLFAGEPDVQQPVAMALDDRGRLWVAEAYSYPHRVPDDQARDRILIFEDEDGDGRFDSRKVFADKLNLVSGLEVGFGGVWVGAAPEFLFIPDADGDDVPDGPPRVLLDGWGYHDTHETLNAFIWGPDGWLYGCHGVFTHSLVGVPGTPKEERVPLNAAIWRYHPTRHEFDVFAHGTSNPWGVDFNDHGQAFCTACVIPHLFHVIQGARYQRQAGSHFNRYTYDDIKTIADHVHWVGGGPHAGNNRSSAAGGGHAHCGAMIYLGGSWPAEYRDQIFMNNIHGARLNMDRLERAGSGYVGRHGPDFLLANDSWSQVINLRYGPDGQVYMIDWYDENQCHHHNTEGHDRTNGRIFKIVYADTPGVQVDLGQKTDLELVALQLHANDWYVRHARRLLQERAQSRPIAPEALAELERLVFDHDDETRRLRALWAWHVVDGVSDDAWLRLLTDENEYVRAWSVQLIGEDGSPDERLLARLGEMARQDESPVVRLYLASAAQRLELSQRWPLVEGLCGWSEDADDHNLVLMYWYAAEPLATADAARLLALASSSPLGQLQEFVVRRIGESGSPEAIDLLVSALAGVDDSPEQLRFLQGIVRALLGRRQVEMPTDWPQVSAELLSSDDEQVRTLTRTLGVTFGDPAALAATRELLLDAEASIDQRRASIAALLSAKDAELSAALQQLVQDPQLRGDALRGLAAYDDPHTPRVILDAYAQLAPAERRDALATLTSRPAYAQELLSAIERGLLVPSDVSADLVRNLRNLQDESLNRRIGEVWGMVRDTDEDKAGLIAQYTTMLTAKPEREPDVAHGRAVYAKTCLQCHRLFGTGGEVGPELTGSNRANLEYLLSNVLDPSALISKDYLATIIATVDGRILTGIVREENDNAVVLQTANETIVVPRDEIDERQPSSKSMMPDDLFQPLGEDDVRALVAYLATSQQTPMLATAENAGAIFNELDLSGWIGDSDVWQVRDGVLVGRCGPDDEASLLRSDLLVSDFRLRVEVQATGSAQGGIQFRRPATEAENGVPAYQVGVGGDQWGRLDEVRGRGPLATSRTETPPVGQWQTVEIVATDSRIQVLLNGKPAVEIDDPAGARRGILALHMLPSSDGELRFRRFELEVAPKLEVAAGKTN